MKSTLSLKKPLSVEKQSKIAQITGVKVKVAKEKPLKNQSSLDPSPAKKDPLISIHELTKNYPKCFDLKNPKPLKKGIMQDILEQGLWTESKNSLRNALSIIKPS
ncbi:MAG: hypothetical protein KBD63_08135 [Bacteriovoracaceae bacterium]|jgi:hypothetical protein|nr:hypothetical protein [Bacteriovoracaceae bacterium]